MRTAGWTLNVVLPWTSWLTRSPYFLGPGNSEFADVDSIARAGSLDVVFQGLVGDFYHFLEVVVRLLLARAYWSRKSSFVCAFVMDRR
jgi:hypothetical protein